ISALFSHLTEKFQHIQLLKIFGTENYEKERFYETATRVADEATRMGRYVFLIRPLSEVAVAFMIFLLVAVFRRSLAFSSWLAIPAMVTYFLIFFRLFDQASLSMTFVSSMFQSLEPFKAYEKLRAAAQGAVLRGGAKTIDRFTKAITFQKVSFQYEPERPVLREVSFEIARGSFVAVVGPTGVGKTTIAHLLAGLYFPTTGKILVDGIDLADLDLPAWRKKIGYVSQDVMIMNDTAKNNIRYGSFAASDDEVLAAATEAHIHEFLLGLPLGYETILGERGVKLSGGQRQRLAIARALLRHPEIIILDEATSALDTETETLVQQALLNNQRTHTIVAIAHRLSTVSRADTIIVLKNGQIMESGNHADLLARNGFYNYMLNLQ
ncbi:MAG: ATP-binding cassette domain-containing protein, partial [Candidatus Magasanikbacteria bacterium]|nr:ATP-binding cassette domain-containing protein [Candidatus Magasanikbacteria bacterium]